MRDPNRIAHLLVLLGRLWKRNPDLRFAQIIEILKSKLGTDDMFYVEDDDLIKLLERIVGDNKNE